MVMSYPKIIFQFAFLDGPKTFFYSAKKFFLAPSRRIESIDFFLPSVIKKTNLLSNAYV